MLGFFSTTIDSPDNVQTIVGNAKIMNGTIKNFRSNPYRRVNLLAQIDHSVDPQDAINRRFSHRPIKHSSGQSGTPKSRKSPLPRTP
jgi:hypothetical protein